MKEIANGIKHHVDSFSPEDRKLILRFIGEAQAYGKCQNTIYWYLDKLKNFRNRFLKKPFAKSNKEDIKRAIALINQNEKYSSWVRYGYKSAIRKFYQIVHGFEWDSKRYPKEVDWIKLDSRIKKDYDILSKQEVLRMIEVANLRDKAIISVLWAGCRLGELWNLRVDDVRFDEYGCVINVRKSKTNPRPIRIELWEHLKNWLDNRKCNNEWLWVSQDNWSKGHKLSKKGIRKMLKRVGRKAGINRPLHPHNFRHSSATWLSQKLTDIELRHYFGWCRGSKCPDLYSHLSCRDTDEKLIRIFNGKPKGPGVEDIAM